MLYALPCFASFRSSKQAAGRSQRKSDFRTASLSGLLQGSSTTSIIDSLVSAGKYQICRFATLLPNLHIRFKLLELLEGFYPVPYDTRQDNTILYRNCPTGTAIMASSTEQQSRKSPASRSRGVISLMQYSLEELRRLVPFLYDVSSRTTTASCNFCAKPEQCKFPLAHLGSSQSDLQRNSCRWQTILDVVFCMSNCPVLREYLSSAHVSPRLNKSYQSAECQKANYPNHKLACQTDTANRKELYQDENARTLSKELDKWAQLQVANLTMATYHALDIFRDPQKASKTGIYFFVNRTTSADPAFLFKLERYRAYPLTEASDHLSHRTESLTRQLGEVPSAMTLYHIIVLRDNKPSEVAKNHTVTLSQSSIAEGLATCAKSREEEQDWFEKYQLLVNSGKTTHPPLDQPEETTAAPPPSQVQKPPSDKSAPSKSKRKKRPAKPPWAASMQRTDGQP